MRWTFRLCLCGLLGAFPASNLYGQGRNGVPPPDLPILEVGYSAKFFYDVDVSDARAVTKVWAEMLIEKTGENAGSETLIFYDLSSIVKALQASVVDIVILTPLEYLEVAKEAPLLPVLTSSAGGNVVYEYALTVHRRSGIGDLAQLQGKKLVIEEGVN